MKNGFLTFLIMLFVVPAFTPWLPHEAVHSLQDYHQTRDHGAYSHSHVHQEHSHKVDIDEAVSHHIHLDALTYFSDYLHVDLKSPQQIIVKAPEQDVHGVDYMFAIETAPQPRYELASIRSRAPPHLFRMRAEKIALYRSTQRLRI